MDDCSDAVRAGLRSPRAGLLPNITREGAGFDSSSDPRFFVSFEGCRLSVRQAGFDAALGKDPAATPRLDEQEIYVAATNAIADGCDLLAISEKLCCGSHENRVLDLGGRWLEHRLVPVTVKNLFTTGYTELRGTSPNLSAYLPSSCAIVESGLKFLALGASGMETWNICIA